MSAPHGKTQEHAVSGAEYRTRLASVYKGMAQDNVDVLVLTAPESLYYLVGFSTFMMAAVPALVVVPGRDLAFITRAVDVPNILPLLDEAPIGGVHQYTDSEDPLVSLTRLILEHTPAARVRIGVEMGSFTMSAMVYAALAAALAPHDLVDCTHIIERLRIIKSPAEIEHHRTAGRIAVKGLLAAIDAVQPGAKDYEIAAVAYDTILRAGGEWSGMAQTVKAGPRAGRAHITWQDEQINVGQPTGMELVGVKWRYHTPVHRTVIHQPRDQYRRTAEAATEANAAGLAKLRAGVATGEVWQAEADVLARYGIGEMAKSRFGYTVGIGFPPNHVQERGVNIVQGGEVELRPGMVFHMLTLLLQPNEYGIGQSTSVVITEDGYEDLTPGLPPGPVLR